MSGYEEHRAQRESLGSFALGHLSDDEATAIQAHLDGCSSCRVELAELASVVPDLGTVDLATSGQRATPPAGLGTAILAAVSQERVLRDRREHRERSRRRLTRVASAAAAAISVLALGLAVGRGTAPTLPASTAPTASVPVERVALTSDLPGVSVQRAGLVAHSWGVEVKIVAAGLRAGTSYRAWVVARSGQRLPAGEFLGIGAKPLTCNLQAALLRTDAVGFLVVGPDGRTVLSAPLPA